MLNICLMLYAEFNVFPKYSGFPYHYSHEFQKLLMDKLFTAKNVS